MMHKEASVFSFPRQILGERMERRVERKEMIPCFSRFPHDGKATRVDNRRGCDGLQGG